ncbi:phage tail tube protein [Acinetobacter baumannii]
MRTIQAVRNATIVIEGNNGQDYIMRNARCGTARVIAQGEVKATFYGDVEEV